MRTFAKLFGLAILGGIAVSSIPARGDTAYHSVYESPITTTDSFSLLDRHGNNVLTPEEYNNAANAVPFDVADVNKDGFISRTEFYASQNAGMDMQNAASLDQIMPAAGGDMLHNDCVYNDEKSCEVRPY